jgi:cathepsin X
MKSEIFLRGPISCGMKNSKEFERYNYGVFSQKLDVTILDYEVSIVGCGYDTNLNIEYWIGRNSWGTVWGEYGFFKIRMY